MKVDDADRRLEVSHRCKRGSLRRVYEPRGHPFALGIDSNDRMTLLKYKSFPRVQPCDSCDEPAIKENVSRHHLEPSIAASPYCRVLLRISFAISMSYQALRQL